MIKTILKDDWYKTATPEEMRIALMHVEQGAMDTLFNCLSEKKTQWRNEVFENCSKDCGWSENEN